MITAENKVIIAFILSSAAILFNDPVKLIIVLGESIAFLKLLGLNPSGGIRRFRQLIYLFLTMALLQNLFSPSGPPILTLFGRGILFRDSVLSAISVVLRVLVLATTGYVFVSMGEKQFIDAMAAIGIPQLILFMTVIGLRFIPIVRDEIKDMLNSVRLRGVEPNELGIRERARFFLNLSIPLIFTTLNYASRVAAVLEARGFGSQRRSRPPFRMGLKGGIITALIAGLVILMCFL